MRIILILIKKEFLQVFRNSLLWKILVLAPLAEFLLFPFTADYEIKNVNIAFIDHDKSSMTADIISKFGASPYFINHGIPTTSTARRVPTTASPRPCTSPP